MTDLSAVIGFIDELLNEPTLSNNVKDALIKVKLVLEDNSLDMEIKVNKALDMLEEIGQDTTIPPFIRTSLWNLTSMLESLS